MSDLPSVRRFELKVDVNRRTTGGVELDFRVDINTGFLGYQKILSREHLEAEGFLDAIFNEIKRGFKEKLLKQIVEKENEE